jgi:hypothetical protein
MFYPASSAVPQVYTVSKDTRIKPRTGAMFALAQSDTQTFRPEQEQSVL